MADREHSRTPAVSPDGMTRRAFLTKVAVAALAAAAPAASQALAGHYQSKCYLGEGLYTFCGHEWAQNRRVMWARRLEGRSGIALSFGEQEQIEIYISDAEFDLGMDQGLARQSLSFPSQTSIWTAAITLSPNGSGFPASNSAS